MKKNKSLKKFKFFTHTPSKNNLDMSKNFIFRKLKKKVFTGVSDAK